MLALRPDAGEAARRQRLEREEGMRHLAQDARRSEGRPHGIWRCVEHELQLDAHVPSLRHTLRVWKAEDSMMVPDARRRMTSRSSRPRWARLASCRERGIRAGRVSGQVRLGCGGCRGRGPGCRRDHLGRPARRDGRPRRFGRRCARACRATSATGPWQQQELAGGRFRVAIIAAGVTRADGSLRFAVEDLLAAGAIIEAIADRGIDHQSPEAAAAASAYRGLSTATRHLINASVSARESRERESPSR